ncbi:hypothetical protein JCM9533A_23410 [Catenuloplanes niger JCM 9533]
MPITVRMLPRATVGRRPASLTDPWPHDRARDPPPETGARTGVPRTPFAGDAATR